MDYVECIQTATGGFSRVPQTTLITGADGKTRRNCADLLAMAVVCENGNGCGKCNACQKAKNHGHTEIIYIEREKDRKTITVSAARDIRSKAYVAPLDGDKKVFIIPEADKLGEEAQNALLKILEEPPVFDRFILCAENASSLLQTIRSRSVEVKISSDGDDVLSGKGASLALDTAKCLVSEDETALAMLLSKYDKDRLTASEALKKLYIIVRDAAVLKEGGKAIAECDYSEIMANSFSRERIFESAKACEHAIEMVENNVKTSLAVSVMFSKFTETRHI